VQASQTVKNPDGGENPNPKNPAEVKEMEKKNRNPSQRKSWSNISYARNK
jgi:hypothetical protein